jgi:hypothetical protein
VLSRLRSAAAAEVGRLDGPVSAGRFEVIMATRQSVQGLIRYVKTQHLRAKQPGA